MKERWGVLMPRLNKMFAAVIFLACTVVLIVSYQRKLQAQLSELSMQNMLLLQTMAQTIDAQLAQVEIIARETAYNEHIIRLLSSSSLPEQILSILFSAGEKLSESEAYLSGLSADLVLLSANAAMPESYDTLVHDSRMAGSTNYTAFLESSALSAWGDPEEAVFSSSAASSVLPYYHKIITGFSTQLGVLRCAVPVKDLFAPLAECSEGALLVMRGDKTLYSSESGTVVPQKARAGTWQENENLYFAVSLDSLDAQLILAAPLVGIRASVMHDTALSALGIFLVGITLWFIARQMVKALLARLHTLTKAVGAIPDGCYVAELPEDGSDEVGLLVRAFNALLSQMNAYYDECLQKERDKRHAQTMALQYQLNPHFLFNALYWIQLQLEEQSCDTAALSMSIEQLGQVLRYNMLGSRLALLSEEEEHARAYVGFVSTTKKIRMHLRVDIPETLHSARILRFTLQPLLENAVRHGCIPDKDLHIHVLFQADAAANRLEIAVHNDGYGISAERVAELQEKLDAAASDGLSEDCKKTGHGTALNNLARRLALTYGDAALLQVKSDRQDTCVRILLPLGQCMP